MNLPKPLEGCDLFGIVFRFPGVPPCFVCLPTVEADLVRDSHLMVIHEVGAFAHASIQFVQAHTALAYRIGSTESDATWSEAIRWTEEQRKRGFWEIKLKKTESNIG
jgi:hypothetical protein